MTVKQKLSLLTTFLFIFSLGASCLADGAFKVYPKTSKVGFELRHFANEATGVFEKYSGHLNFSKSNPQAAQVGFSVDVTSVDTDNTKRDNHLRAEEYFDVDSHPKMTFESKVFKPVGKNRYMVTGPLTIKGHTKNVSVPVKLERSQTLWATGEEALEFSCSFKIDRTEFGVGESSTFLGSEVTINLFLEFRKEP